MQSRSVARCALVLPLLLFAATGCATSDAAPAARDSQQFTVSPTPSPSASPSPTVSLPPGAEDPWEMELTGDLMSDLETHYDGMHRFTGQNGYPTASVWVARATASLCESDTEPLGGLGSDLDGEVRSWLVGPDDFNAEDALKVLASYGCPERFEDINRAILKLK